MPPKATTSPAAYIVLESFVADVDGAPVVYRKGELVHPDDPYLALTPDRFGPLVFPHPVKRGRALGSPEVRAD